MTDIVAVTGKFKNCGGKVARNAHGKLAILRLSTIVLGYVDLTCSWSYSLEIIAFFFPVLLFSEVLVRLLVSGSIVSGFTHLPNKWTITVSVPGGHKNPFQGCVRTFIWCENLPNQIYRAASVSWAVHLKKVCMPIFLQSFSMKLPVCKQKCPLEAAQCLSLSELIIINM